MLFSGLYSNVETRFNDWVIQSGRAISNLALDYINRAMEELWKEDDWDLLKKRATLTVSSGTASLPADFGKITAIYYDSDSDNKPNGYYWKDGDIGTGYQLNSSFSKASGFTLTITFFGTISSTPMIEYKAKLDAFTGSGTEYSFFPENLLLLKSQLIYLSEANTSDGERNAIIDEYNKALISYKRDVQSVNIQQIEGSIRDSNGNQVWLPHCDLTGGTTTGRYQSRSYDMRNY